VCHDLAPCPEPELSLGSVLGGYHVIRKEAEPFCRTSSSVRLWWEFKEPKGPKGRAFPS
jgi:hypothetical protein